MIAAHLYEQPVELPAHVLPDVASVVMRCLAKSPGDRYPDVASLAAALAASSVVEWTSDQARDWWIRVGRGGTRLGELAADSANT